jgi:hypothetical protein
MGAVATGGLLILGAVNTVMGAKARSTKRPKGARRKASFRASYTISRRSTLSRAATKPRPGRARRREALRARSAPHTPLREWTSIPGRPADVVANDKQLGALDVLTIKQNAAREAHGFEMQANLARKAGANAARNYNNQAISTLLTGARRKLSAPITTSGRSSSGGSVPRSGSSGSAGSTNGGYNNGTASR